MGKKYAETLSNFMLAETGVKVHFATGHSQPLKLKYKDRRFSIIEQSSLPDFKFVPLEKRAKNDSQK